MKYGILAAVLATSVLSIGCDDSDRTATDPAGASFASIDGSGITPSELARSLSLALNSDDGRRTVFSSMDQSNVKEGKVYLPVFLEGDGRSLLERMDAEGDRSGVDIIMAARSLGGGLEFYLPVREHREQWDGSRNYLVAFQMDEGSAPIAFDPEGNERILSLEEPPSTPTFVIVPAEDFRSDGSSPARALSDRGNHLGPQTMVARADGEMFEDTTSTASGNNDLLEVRRAIGIDEHIHYMRTANDHEPWARGAPEFKIMLAGTSDGDSNAELSKALYVDEDIWDGSDDDENAKWRSYDPSLSLVVWDTDYGTRVRISCLELDGPISFQFDVEGDTEIAGATVSYSASFGREDSDDPCGEDYITPRVSTGEWTLIPNNDPAPDYDGTSDLQWYGTGYDTTQ